MSTGLPSVGARIQCPSCCIPHLHLATLAPHLTSSQNASAIDQSCITTNPQSSMLSPSSSFTHLDPGCGKMVETNGNNSSDSTASTPCCTRHTKLVQTKLPGVQLVALATDDAQTENSTRDCNPHLSASSSSMFGS